MQQSGCYQREVGNARFGNNTTIHQDNNTITKHYNLHLPLKSARASIRIIPYPLNEDLVNRPDLMNKLNALLPQASQLYQSAALWGLGGSGKTQIALNYAYQRCNDTNCSIFWVHADSEAAFSQDYKTIAQEFGIDEHLESEDLFVAVRERIAAQPNWVLILDNADDLTLFGVGQARGQSKNLNQYIPHAPIGTVLWTSRDAHVAGTLVGTRRARDLEINEEELETAALLEELQWLPLAITQAGAYMRRTSTSAKEYSSLLAQSKRRWDLLKENEFDRHRRDGVPNNVLETWSISIDRLGQESEIAYNILHVIAYVANQNIPHEMITAILEHSDNNPVQPEKLEAEATKAITRLKEFSFIGIHRMDDGSRSYEMHKLVQEATRYGLSVWKPSFLNKDVSKKEGERYFSRIALQVIRGLFPKSTPETWTQCEKYLAHAVQVGDWADLNQRQDETCLLFNRVCNFLDSRGRWRENELLRKRCLELEQKLRGNKHPRTLASMANLAATYWAQGRYSEAEKMEVQVLDLQREILGSKHLDTILSMGSLASTYHDQGRYSEAEALKTQVLDLRREILGNKHPDTIYTMGSLATTYHNQGRYNKAEALQVQVLNLQREILGDKHPDTIYTMGSLAIIYSDQDWHSKAEALQVQVLDLQREILGDKHPDTIYTMGSLAIIYSDQDWHSKAEALQVQVLDLQREILGDKHPDTISSMGSLAAMYFNQDWHSKAEALEVKVLDLQREILGKEHPDTLTAMHNLAWTWNEQRRNNDALVLMRECVQYRRSVLGPEHPHTLLSIKDLEEWESKDGTVPSLTVLAGSNW